MPDYVPIQDLTIVGSIANDDLFPMSDGSGAYAVRGSTIKSYAATDAQAAAADAALSKTAAQDAATAAGLAQTAAEEAASDVSAAISTAEAAVSEAESVVSSIGVIPSMFGDNAIPLSYFSNSIWESGYITNTGGKGSNSANARSAFFELDEIKAITIPLPYKVKFVWYTDTVQSGYISHDSNYHNCGVGIVNYASPPSNALYFRLQLAKQDLSTITTSDLESLQSATVLFTTYKIRERQDALGFVADAVFSRELQNSYHNSTFSFTKGSGVNVSTGKSSSTAYAARTGIMVCAPSMAYAIKYDDAYRAAVFFYDDTGFPTDDNNTYMYAERFRFSNSGHKVVYVTPATARAVVIVLYALDYHTLTDNDKAEIESSFRLCRISSALENETQYTAPPARARFVEYMAEMCEKLGMDDTTFANASGLTAESSTTAADELKMALAVAGNPVACDIWSTQSRDFKVGGSNARTISVTSNVFSDWLTETTYRKLGGKGGTLEASSGGGTKRKAACVMHNISDIPVALALMGPGDFAYSNIVNCTRELCGMMATKLAGGTPTEGTYLTQLISSGGGYAAVPVPNCAESYANTYDSAQILTRDNALYNGEDVANVPASTTKTMTMLCALSVMTDLQEVISLIPSDIQSGSGSAFASGDKLLLIDALRIMMMESSNTLAEAVGRVVGDRLLTIEARRDG